MQNFVRAQSLRIPFSKMTPHLIGQLDMAGSSQTNILTEPSWNNPSIGLLASLSCCLPRLRCSIQRILHTLLR